MMDYNEQNSSNGKKLSKTMNFQMFGRGDGRHFMTSMIEREIISRLKEGRVGPSLFALMKG